MSLLKFLNNKNLFFLGELLSAIKKEFDSLENFISKFNTLTAAVQGLIHSLF